MELTMITGFSYSKIDDTSQIVEWRRQCLKMHWRERIVLGETRSICRR